MAVVVRSLLPRQDAKATAQVLEKTWPWEGHLRWLKRLPKPEWKNHRVAVAGGRVVAYLRIVPLEIYVGRAVLSVGGIAGVCTDPAARMKGYARALMEDAIGFLRTEGYDFALLYGIPDFYQKFGCEVVMGRHFVTVGQNDIPAEATRFRRSAVTKKDRPALLRLYNRQARFRDGNCRRTRMPSRDSTFKIVDARGRIAGYAAWSSSNGSLQVKEAVARDADAGRSLLLALKAAAWDLGAATLNVQMPFGYPVTDAMRPLNCTATRVNTFRKGCMGRVLNLKALARKMAPEWQRLLSMSQLSNKSGRVAVQIDGEVLVIRFSKGRLTAAVAGGKAGAVVPQQRFSQMLFGYAPVKAIGREAGVRIRKARLRLLEILFPERNSFLFAADEF